MTIDIASLIGNVDLDSSRPARESSRPSAASATGSAHKSSTRKPSCLYIDIETVPDESRMSLFGLEPVPPVPEIKDPDIGPGELLKKKLDDISKVLESSSASAEWLDVLDCLERSMEKPRSGLFTAVGKAREARQKAVDAQAERNKLLSVTPEFNRIVALGWAIGDDEPQADVVNQRTGECRDPDLVEGDLLCRFWQLVSRHTPLVGYNVLSFDLPTLFVRSAILHEKPSKKLDLRPWGGDVLDLMKLRFPTGPAKRLKDLARIYGIDVPCPDVDGSNVMELWQSDPGKVAEYVRSDIAVTRAIHKFYAGYFC